VSHQHQQDRKYIYPGERVDVDVEYQADEPVDAATLGLSLTSLQSQVVFARDLDLTALGLPTLYGRGRVRVPLTSVPLLDGTYKVTVTITDRHRAILTREARSEFDVMNPTDSRGVTAVSVGDVELFSD
jgi:hypothetical protein